MRFSSCLLIATLLVGCVDSSRRPAGDTTDTAAPDTAAPDTSAPGDTTGPEDTTAPSDVIAPDDGDAGCQPEACPAPGPDQPCLRASCVDGACAFEAVEDNTPCSDGNACSAPDTCQQGACEGGPGVDCAEPSVCMMITADPPTCDATTGCPWGPRLGGFPCGDGPICADGWRVPASVCDGQGSCRDYSQDVPPGIHPLAGDWFFVGTTGGSAPELHTTRAVLSLGATLGTFEASRVVSTAPDLADRFGSADQPGSNIGELCAAFAGDLDLTLGDRTWSGFVDREREVMVLTELGDNELAIAVRKHATPSSLDGKYMWFSLDKAEGGTGKVTYSSRTGLLALSGGQVLSGSQTRRRADAGPTYLFEAGAQFQIDDGLLKIDLPYQIQDGEAVTQVMRLVGASALNGDLILLTREDEGLHYGAVVLVRSRELDANAVLGRWRFATLAGGLASVGQVATDPRLEEGHIRHGADNAIDGAYVGDDLVSTITGGWWATDADLGVYSHRVSFGNDLVHHSGYVTSDASFIVATRVTPTNEPTAPTPLFITAGEGSLLLMVAPASFVEGWREGEPPPLQ